MKNKQMRLHLPLWKYYFDSRNQLLLLCLVVLGMIIRVINAVSTPLWRDEIYIFFTSHDNPLWKLITQQHWDTAHPPLHSVLLHFWQLISIQPLFLRLPSLVLSFFILYLIPILAVKLSRNNKFFPFLFLFLFSISHTQISMNMVVRPYPLFILLMIISLILLLNMLEKKYSTMRVMYYFVVVNLLMTYLDYSAIWLYLTYLVFFICNYFFFRPNKSQLEYTFKALFLTACFSLTIVPLLLYYLNNSLYLARNIESLKTSQAALSQGIPMYILITRSTGEVVVYNKSMNKLIKTHIPSDPFPENKVYFGYNLSPLSYLMVNEMKICTVNRGNTIITNLVEGCKFKSIISPLRNRVVNSVSSYIIDRFFGNSLGVLNTHTNNWEVNLYKKGVSIGKSDYILLSMNLSSIYFLDPTGVNIFGKHKINVDWWKNITRFTISPTEGQYRIVYYDGTSPNEQHIFGNKGVFEKFSGAILFFTGLPDSYSKYGYYLIMISFISLGQIAHLYLMFQKKQYQFLLMFFLFIIPISSSLLISYFFVPIFLGRNLHLVNISYLCSVSLFVAYFISYRGILKRIINSFGVVIILYFTVIFIIQFPYLHYVDPPYDVTKIMRVIERSTLPKKHIILGNSDHYYPLFRYALLFSKKIHELPITTLEFLEKDEERTRSLEKYGKMNTDLFFIQFGLSIEEKGDDFSKISKLLDCKLKQVKIPYVFFAQCQ